MSEIAELDKLCIICFNTKTLTPIPQLKYQEIPAQTLLKDLSLIKFEKEDVNNRSLCRKCCKLLYSFHCMRKQFIESQETFKSLLKNEPINKHIQLSKINQPDPNECIDCVCLNVTALNLPTICRICFQKTDIHQIGNIIIEGKSAIELYEEFSNQNIQPDEMLCLTCLDQLFDICKFRNKFENHDFIVQNLQNEPTNPKLEPDQMNYSEIIEDKLEIVPNELVNEPKQTKAQIKNKLKTKPLKETTKDRNKFDNHDFIVQKLQKEQTNTKLEPDQTNYSEIIEDKLEIIPNEETHTKTLNKNKRVTKQLKEITKHRNKLDFTQNSLINTKLEPNQTNYSEIIEDKLENAPNKLTNEQSYSKTLNKNRRIIKRETINYSLNYKLKCRHCPMAFDTEAEFTQHTSENETHTSCCSKIECSVCKRLIRSPSTYKAHFDSIHRGLLPFACKICSRRFGLRENLNRHLLTHASERRFVCERCGAKFIRLTSLTEHAQSRHGDAQCACDECGRIFRTLLLLRVHKRSHAHANGGVQLKFVCETCGKAYRLKSSLLRHQLTHGERRNVCVVCNKGYYMKKELKNHMCTHTGEKRFACEVCCKRFTCSGSLKKHMRTHTGVTPFVCEVCSKGFTCSTSLKEHLRIHTGEKPFKCKDCLELFRTSRGLRRHIMKIHGVKGEDV